MNLRVEIVLTARTIQEYVAKNLLNPDDYRRREEAFERLPVLIDCLAKLVDIAERAKIAGLDEPAPEARP